MLNHAGTNLIETNHLILRKFDPSDRTDMLELWAADPNIQHSYGEPVYITLDEVNSLLNKYIVSYQNLDYYRWAIIEKTNGRCIGQIAFFLVDSINNFSEIEYCISADFQCMGYATEATKAIIKYGFEEINLHKIQICHKSNNLASKRVIEKCGFTFEGSLRDFFFINGKYYDRLYYSILKREYK